MPRSPLPAGTESQCDALIRQLGGAVVQFGKKGRRTRNTFGIPDRLYFVKGRMWYFECKSKNDYLSAEQILFLTNVLTHDGLAGCGNRDDLCALLNCPTPTMRWRLTQDQVLKYSTRKGR